MRLKRNKYKLDRKADAAARHIVAEVAVTYDIDSDEMRSIIAVRDDVKDEALQLRVARQLENAVRTVMPVYRQEMELVERLAKMGADIGVEDLDYEISKHG
jgi:hypothetical protein